MPIRVFFFSRSLIILIIYALELVLLAYFLVAKCVLLIQ